MPDGPGAVLLVTADHGNADEMRDAAGAPVTAHSLNPVPILVAGRAVAGRRLHDGVLADVTPTILELAGLADLAGRHRPLPAGACATIRRPCKTEVRSFVNPLFAVGQIVVGIALMISILLQARGTGLSGAFGGDSAVYRSRRGVERRLWQFTIVLMVLFVLFSLASFALSRRRPADAVTAPCGRIAGSAIAAPVGGQDPLTQRDRGIVAVLGVLLVALSIAIALPGPTADAGATPGPTDALASPSSGPSLAADRRLP